MAKVSGILENRFTGWTDVKLTSKGQKEAKKAGELISNYGLSIDLAFVSYLKRAVKTNEICLNQLKSKKSK